MNRDPSRLIGAITQLQILHRQGRFTVPMRMKWLPSSLRNSSLSSELTGLFGHLQPLLRVNLNRVSQGQDLPPDTADHLYAFYRALVQVRLSSEDSKAVRAREVLDALAEELDAVDASGENRERFGLGQERVDPSWLTLFRLLDLDDDSQREFAGELARFLAKREAEGPDPWAVALLTFLARGGSSLRSLHALVRTGLDYPQRWDRLLSAPFLGRLIEQYDASAQRELIEAWITLLAVGEREAEQRRQLLESLERRLDGAEDLRRMTAGLGEIVRGSGTLVSEAMQAFQVRQPQAVLDCLLPSDGVAASADAQYLVGRLLLAHDIAAQPVFQRFCSRIARIELAVGLRAALEERILNRNKLKQHLINSSWPEGMLRQQLRSATDPRQQLLNLLLLALSQWEGEVLGEVTRALSLIDVAIRQDKIDPRHLGLLMGDLRRKPVDGLLTLVDEERIDARSSDDPELYLLYLNLRIISQTADRIEAVDLDHLSRTLRKLKIRDARGRQ